ncbi:hypothetical protein [Bacillus amyloliquefaciens]|uniref:hypothetical protein n=1 Tax=Bacillus amyloliquefaciens TaxID=1390 RepID=UPI003D22005D
MIVNGRKKETVERTVEELSAYGTVHGIAADLSRQDEADDLMKRRARNRRSRYSRQ